MRVLGVDPGTRCIGYGCLDFEGRQCRTVDFGFARINTKAAFPIRLEQIYDFVSGLCKTHRPDVVAVEEVFVSRNAKTSLKLGHARGVVLLAAVQQTIPVSEYAPREIKQSVVGRGDASKDQIQAMVSRMLNIPVDQLQEDAADGLATALCHGLRSKSPIKNAGRESR